MEERHARGVKAKEPRKRKSTTQVAGSRSTTDRGVVSGDSGEAGKQSAVSPHASKRARERRKTEEAAFLVEWDGGWYEARLDKDTEDEVIFKYIRRRGYVAIVPRHELETRVRTRTSEGWVNGMTAAEPAEKASKMQVNTSKEAATDEVSEIQWLGQDGKGAEDAAAELVGANESNEGWGGGHVTREQAIGAAARAVLPGYGAPGQDDLDIYAVLVAKHDSTNRAAKKAWARLLLPPATWLSEAEAVGIDQANILLWESGASMFGGDGSKCPFDYCPQNGQHGSMVLHKFNGGKSYQCQHPLVPRQVAIYGPIVASVLRYAADAREKKSAEAAGWEGDEGNEANSGVEGSEGGSGGGSGLGAELVEIKEEPDERDERQSKSNVDDVIATLKAELAARDAQIIQLKAALGV